MTEAEFVRACPRKGCGRPLRWYLAGNAERAACPIHGRQREWLVIDTATGVMVDRGFFSDAKAA